MVNRAPDIRVSARPSAPRLAEPPVFDIPAGNALRLERVAHRSEIAQRGIVGLPASAVDEDNDWVRTGAGGQTQLCELARIIAVGEAMVGRARGQRLKIRRRHERRRRGRTTLTRCACRRLEEPGEGYEQQKGYESGSHAESVAQQPAQT